MRASELRVGNWVKVDFGASGKDEQQIDITTLEYCFNGGDGRCEPIPLTKEWLKKFGFKVCKLTGFVTQFVKGNIIVYYDEDNEYCYVKIAETYIDEISRLRINYVHTLQNWWYANTKEELELKD